LLSQANEVVLGGFVLFYTLDCADGHCVEIQWPREEEFVGPYKKVFEATWEELISEVFYSSLKSISKGS